MMGYSLGGAVLVIISTRREKSKEGNNVVMETKVEIILVSLTNKWKSSITKGSRNTSWGKNER